MKKIQKFLLCVCKESLDILNELLNLIYPQSCSSCLEIITGNGKENFCDICKEGLVVISKPCCSICAEQFQSGEKKHLCINCLKKSPPFKGVFALYAYGGPIAQSLKRLKYSGSGWVASSLGILLASVIDWSVGFDFVVPVPLSRTRLITRGYNQSALLAHVLAKRGKVKLVTSGLKRKGGDDAQVGKTREQRKAALSKSFYTKSRNTFAGKKILLVDDIVTTTATARAASAALKKAGAKEVYVACVARTVSHI